ncbi:Membrane-bound lytic murein transglycosylase C [Candidatus Terasakiella magnetica]|uniref:Membrane-bound lytic murein transglycosylase C n=1 Tax=Candidatus Terasakiella magnetica TaxID=1867952 RepID=A0A1C3RJI3_9PROT|nr:murein transglycosylase domain-containing protein [Candidatus Terasakiella magnetica]SCA57393.1 Membrane-bound lytic murein transglycosylase C [Candidatus Terasakiella magnetica]
MISRRTFLAGCLPAALCACSSAEIVRTIEAASRGGSLSGAVRSVATSKARSWASNPKSFLSDIRRFEDVAQDFVHDVVDVWGKDNATAPSEQVYVKYSDDYKSRGIIDFQRSIVRVETLVPTHLKQAIVTTVLSPSDPRGVDLFSAKPVKLGSEPFLYKQVVDHEAKDIRWQWRANRFADYLIAHKRQSREVTLNSGERKTQSFVEFALVRNHTATRSNKYGDLVNRYAAKYRLERALVYAIIQTESNFNPYAVSWVPAYGLMQIVPKTAGRDAFEVVHGRPGTPSRDYLFNVENNIRMGCAYLHILQTRYLAKVSNPTTREYCIIAAYNGGAGNVLRSFHSNRDTAFAMINRSSPNAVYNRLRAKMPTESQHYLHKVTTAKRKYA